MKKRITTLIALAAAVVLAITFLCGGTYAKNHPGWSDNQERAHQIAEIAREIGLAEDDPIIQRAKTIWWFEEQIKEMEEPINIFEIDPELAEKAVEENSDTAESDDPEVYSYRHTPYAKSLVEVPAQFTATFVEFSDVPEVGGTDEVAELQEEIPKKYTKGVENYTQEDIDIVACVIYNEGWYKTTERHKELIAGALVNRVNCPWVGSSIKECVCWPGQYLPAYADYNSSYMKEAMACKDWEYLKEIAERALKGEVDIPYDVIFQAEFKQGRGVYDTHQTSYSTTYFCYSLYEFDDPMLTEG